MIPEVNPYNNYRGDGVATLFDYDFFIQNGSQLIVEHIDENNVVTRLEENIDYEIVVLGEEFAGYIKFPIKDSKFEILQENQTLSLQLTLPFEQISEYGQSSLLDLNSIEFSLDYLTRLCQILKRQMERSVKVNEGSEATPEQLLKTINNNVTVSTNAATLASKKADEAMESANIAINSSEEIDNKINGFNESYENIKEGIIEEGEKQIENIERTGFYMRDDKLYFINSKGEEEEFKSGGGGLELGDIGFTQGYIDESLNQRRLLNKTDNYIIQEQFQEFTAWLKNSAELNPDMACTNEEYETALAMSIDNTCDKYVIDDVAGTIRLPKYPDYFIGGLSVPSGNIPVVGNGMSMGLMNGTQGGGLAQILGGSLFLSAITQGYGQDVGKTYTNPTGINHGTVGLTNDQSKSGIIAKLSATKTDQIKGTYFIQVATGSSTSADFSNELQLNNPKVLLESKYFNPEIYNASWLIANGSFNGSNAVHPSVYEALLIEYNSDIAVGTTSESGYTKRGLSVKLSTDTDISEYDFVLNTTDETFRLPIFDGSEEATTTNFQDFALGDSGNSYIAPANGWFSLNITGKNARMYTSALSVGTSSGDSSDKNTQIYIKVSRGERVYVKYGSYTAVGHFKFVYAKGNGSLYYFVGSALQNTGIVNVGRIEEKVATLIPDNSSVICDYIMPSTKYVDLTLGASGAEYIAPACGWFVVNLQGSRIRANTIPKNNSQGLMFGVNNELQASLLVDKGGKMVVRYDTITVNSTFRFYYMKGEV